MHRVSINQNGQDKTVSTNLPITHQSKRKKVWLGKQGGKYIQAPNLKKRAKRLKAKQHLIISGLQTKCLDRIKNPAIFGLKTQDDLKSYLVEAMKLLKKIYAHWEQFRDHCLSLCSWLGKEAFA